MLREKLGEALGIGHANAKIFLKRLNSFKIKEEELLEKLEEVRKMDRLFKPSVLVQILEEFGFRFTKSLGQNFLIDGNIVRRIADGAGVEEGSNVLEIGPGVGTLTEELLLRGANVLAVEIDKNLVDIHKKTLNYDRVKIIYDDFLRLDTEEIKSYLKGPIKVVANLPYYVTTRIITKIFRSDLEVESITVTGTKRSGEQICSRDRHQGLRLTISVYKLLRRAKIPIQRAKISIYA